MNVRTEPSPASTTVATRLGRPRPDSAAPSLRVDGLTVKAAVGRGQATAILRGVSFDLWQGRTLVLLGESGSGKSMTARAILGLLPGNITSNGQIQLAERRLDNLSAKQINAVRGDRIAFIPQDPSGALNPFVRVANQIVEVLRTHRPDMSRKAAKARAIDLLGKVRIADPERIAHAWPHELSGGMRQRVAIAIALSCEPEVLIADEPTTALDVTVQAQVLDLFRALLADSDSSLLLITHDVGVAREVGDDVAVMYAGRIVESGPGDEVLNHPRHPYTRALLGAVPRATAPRGSLIPIVGQPPLPAELTSGCAFMPRCPEATDICSLVDPQLAAADTTTSVEAACLHIAPSAA
jgi:oligopeptide/dipeptide ABC transporter ATP-binding protein